MSLQATSNRKPHPERGGRSKKSLGSGPFRYENTIVGYSLNRSWVRMASQAASRLGTSFLHTSDIRDLIAFPYFCLIANCQKLASSSKDALQVLREVIGAHEKRELAIILTGAPIPSILAWIKAYAVKAPSTVDLQWLELTLLHASKAARQFQRDHRRHESVISRRMLMLLQAMNGVTVRCIESCLEFSVSRRTFYRDIRFLLGMGELLEYDRKSRGYRLTFSRFMDLKKIRVP
jgi:hypothetical protein